jgi:hypothetical protein
VPAYKTGKPKKAGSINQWEPEKDHRQAYKKPKSMIYNPNHPTNPSAKPEATFLN